MPPQHDRRSGPRQAGIPARKRWGQNFLANPATAERICEAARIGPEDTVLEIGPGEGALTRPLAARARCVVAVEIDPLRAEALAGEFGPEGNVRIFQGDVLERPLRQWLAGAGDGCGDTAPARREPSLQRRDADPRRGDRGPRDHPALGGDGAARGRAAIRGASGLGRLRVPLRARGRARDGPHPVRPASGRLPSAAEGHVERARADPAGRGARRGPRPPRAVPRLARLQRPAQDARQRAVLGRPRARWESGLAALGKTAMARAEELSLEDFLALARDWRPLA